MNVLSLAQDLSARICHDIGGPLGALSGALDLAEVEPVEALSVARDGATAMRLRLRLWRAVAGAGAGPLGRSGLAELLDGTLSSGRVVADLSGLPEAPLPAPLAQAALAAVMLGSEALPRGGTVYLAGEASGLAIWPEGRNAAWPHCLTAALAGDEVSGPRDVMAPLLLHLAAAAGMGPALAMGREGAAAPLTLMRQVVAADASRR
ncbi:histidine phosphotransferase family protein [Roseomonas sp. KE2513]|uniref:histidine phosphotransferase family protein n=1 Tax=Roseomonas sp. KE2513 TaxID=2479202 RepID=UPI0018DF9B72|nr:histidine phosphotransferase family protein [Roseomonas sp. KE2513]